jgi:uncharacterized membrane protein YfcA
MLFIAIGLAAGILSGIIGIGGGVVIVPALALLAKFPAKMATGTSLGALMIPVGVLGVITYYRAGNVNVKASLFIALGLFVGVFIGSQAAQYLSDNAIRKTFAVFLLATSVKLWFS